MQVVAHAVRSGIAALNVVTAALDTDPRTRDVDVVFARGRDEVARAIAAADGPAVVAWSFYSPDAPRAAADLAWLRAHAPAALHVAGGVHATAEPAATVREEFSLRSRVLLWFAAWVIALVATTIPGILSIPGLFLS